MSQTGTILVVDDEKPALLTLEALLTRRGWKVLLAPTGAAARDWFAKGPIDLVLLDLGLPDVGGLELLQELREANPGTVFLVITGQDSISNAIESIKLGAFHFVGKPFATEELLALIQRAMESRAIRQEAETLRKEKESLTRRLAAVEDAHRPILRSRAMREIEELIARVAASDSNILLTGESGVGKEVLASLVHQLSPRAGGPMVKLNCAAFPPQMIEGELFGYAKGAFTGAAHDFPGLIEASSGGTLFLDEIAEMPPELQTRFLRVLQEREYRRLGTTLTVKADFRLVAATNRNPQQAVAEGRLRQDLYYRINTFTIEIPPLRERREDIAALAGRFANEFAVRLGKPNPGVSPEAMERLEQYPWPGNVRELRNAIEYGAVLSRDGFISLELLPQNLRLAPEVALAAAMPSPGGGQLLDLEARERQAILEALARTRGNKKAAAELLGIQRPTLYAKLKRYAIET